MAVLHELKSYLQELNYPGINIMQDNEVADIFSKKNRLYFVTWFVQQWDGGLVLPADEKSKVNLLSEILCDNGFCKSQESIKFIHDDFDLMPNEQFEIMYRMLYNLHLLKSEQETKNTCDINCAEQMRILSKLDINIFPTLGPIQNKKWEERVQKFQELQEELKQLEQNIKCYNVKEDINVGDDLDSLYKNGSESPDLIKHVSVLMNDSLFLLKSRNSENKGVFNESFERIIANCNISISDVLKLYENKNSIGTFCMDSGHLEETPQENDIMKRVSMLSQEILLID